MTRHTGDSRLVLTLATAGLAAGLGALLPLTHVWGDRPAQTTETARAYLPLVLLGNRAERTPLTPAVTVTSRPTPTPTASPTERTTPTASPTALAASAVLLQVASYGGLAPDTQFGVDRVLASPWFTLYETGAVLTLDHAQARARAYHPLLGRLDPQAVDDLIATWIETTDFFGLRLPDESGLCVPDLATTHVHLRAPDPAAGRPARTVAIYGLEWYERGESPCRPRFATPQPPTAELTALAQAVAALRERPPEASDYWPAGGALVVTRDRPAEGLPAWPLDHDLALASRQFLEVGELPLRPAEVARVMATIAGEVQPRWSMARFAQRGQAYVVGLRLEPPNWDAYVGAPGALDTPTPTDNRACPPLRPKCTAGPSPTTCRGPVCPTPPPCPCQP